MNDFAFLLFTTQKYSSFNPPYFPKRTLKFFLNSIPACSVHLWLISCRCNKVVATSVGNHEPLGCLKSSTFTRFFPLYANTTDHLAQSIDLTESVTLRDIMANPLALKLPIMSLCVLKSIN